MEGIKILWFEAPDNKTTANYGESLGRRLGIHIDAINVFDIKFEIKNNQSTLTVNNEDIVQKYDAIIIRSCLPYISETIILAKLFYEGGKTVIDESMANEAFVISKMHDYIRLSKNEINIPNTLQLHDLSQAIEFINTYPPPYIIKSIHGDSGRHVYKVNNIEEIEPIFFKYRKSKLIIQEFINSKELYKVSVIGYKAIQTIGIHHSLDEENLLIDESTKCLSTSDSIDLDFIRRFAEKCAKALSIEFCKVDIKLKNGQPYILEANRRAGILGFKKETGYEVGIDLINYAVHKIKVKNE